MSHRTSITRAALFATVSVAALVAGPPATAATAPAAVAAPLVPDVSAGAHSVATAPAAAVPAPAAPAVVATALGSPGTPAVDDRAERIDLASFDRLPAPTAARASAAQIAMSKVGKPYRYGAAGPNAFDCSGLVMWTYKQLGVSLPHSSRAMSGVGTPVSRADLQPGDLVFFYKPISHVAIYIGNGKIVHASQSGSPVKVADLASQQYTTARRV